MRTIVRRSLCVGIAATIAVGLAPSLQASASDAAIMDTTTATPKRTVGYFTAWSVYGRNYHIKNVETSGAAANLTHIIYAFGNVKDGLCASGDTYADYGKAYSASTSVDGIADSTAAGVVRGNFGQLRRLKAMHPNLKVIYSFGGWTWSTGFPQAAQNPAAFAESCFRLVEDPRWADVFDGIDIDWEFPNACGQICDTSGPNALTNVLAAMRSRFGSSALVTAAITGSGRIGGTMDKSDYLGASQYVDWLAPMTYEYAGSWSKTTALHAALSTYTGIPASDLHADYAVQRLKQKGIPASKLMLGVSFFGRGWTGTNLTGPGAPVTGVAGGSGSGTEPYGTLKDRCPSTGTAGGSAYAACGDQWWSYDTQSTMTNKMTYVKEQNLAGAFTWELSGDSANGELIAAMANGLA